MKSPDHVRDQLTQRQVREWVDFYQRHPFGELAADLRNALNCVVNYRGKRRVNLNSFRMNTPKRRKQSTITTAEQLEHELHQMEELASQNAR